MKEKLFGSGRRPHFSGHETFPLRQLWLRKAYDKVALCGGAAPRSTFNNPEAIAAFGVGKNMVSAIRHWGLACNVICEIEDGYVCGSVGEALFGAEPLDPFLEKPGSTWLLHWIIAGEGHRSTTWNYLFNNVTAQNFEKQMLIEGLRENQFLLAGNRVSESTLSRDIDVCLRSYVPKDNKGVAEEFCEPVLAELGLITAARGSYGFRIGPKPSLPDGIFLYALTAYWRQSGNDANTLAFSRIAQERGSPGMTFKLDMDSVAERLVNVESRSNGVYAWSDSAGIRQVIRRKNVRPEEFLPLAYQGNV